jgi:hypothetical protein
MAKQNQAAETKSDRKSRPKVEPTVVEELADDLIGLARLPGGAITAVGGGTIKAQVARLNDPRLQRAQRRALATHIGRVQGNRHLQRVMVASKGQPQIHHSPEIVANEVNSTSSIDRSRNSTQIGAIAGTSVAYGACNHQIRINAQPDTVPTSAGGDNWEVCLRRVELTFDVNNTIYVTSQFPEDSCRYRWDLEHEQRHASDAHDIVEGQRNLLINDLQSLPGPDNPTVVQGVPAAQQERSRITNRVDTLRRCAQSQACYDACRAAHARDSREYPTAFSSCPQPRPPVPQVPAPGSVRVPCRQPPTGCPRPIRRFP